MRTHLITILLLTTCIGGCAQTLPPHEGLNQAVTKSFATSGFNYSSKSRITELTLPKKEQEAAPTKKPKLPIAEGLEVIRGLSINMDGAVDMTNKKSQVIYDLRYDKDNLLVSLKLPMLMDYGTQTLYVGTSIFTTILETIYPQAPATRGKMIKIDLNKLLQEQAPGEKADMAKMIVGNRLSGKNFDLINDAIKAAVLKELPKLKDDCFSDQPLSDQDRQAGTVRSIRVQLGHSDSIALALGTVESVGEALYHQELITKQEYAVLLTLTDPQFLAQTVEKFSMATTFDVGISPAGQVASVEGQYDIADREGLFRLGMTSVSNFSNYGAPRFSLSPETGGIVDFMDIMEAIKAAAAQAPADEEAAPPEAIDGVEPAAKKSI